MNKLKNISNSGKQEVDDSTGVFNHEKQYYHYTSEIKLKEILETGVIKLAVKSAYNKAEKPVAWVSTNLHWENTATKMVATIFGGIKQLTFKEQVENLGCARIALKGQGLMTWAKLKHVINIDSRIVKALEETAKLQGANPIEWYGSLTPIKKERWIKAEVYNNGKWELFEDFI